MLTDRAFIKTPYIITSPTWKDEFKKFLDILPESLARTCLSLEDELVEVVLDMGRPALIRTAAATQAVESIVVTEQELDEVISHLSPFNGDNRAGITGTLHRISALRNRDDKIIGLTLRVGRALYGTSTPLHDLLGKKRSMLLLGPPGVGKTTILREAARYLADEHHLRVMIIDTSNEIAGDGDIPHIGIGQARRLQVPNGKDQARVMIEAVENHMPQVIVVDEIGTEAESEAARTIAERGVQILATAHGGNLANLLKNPTLNTLLGGIQSVTLSDEEAFRRGTNKTVLERIFPPTFDVLVECKDRETFIIHKPLSEVVDNTLQGDPPIPEVRKLNPDGTYSTFRDTTPSQIYPFGISLVPKPEPVPQKFQKKRSHL